MTTLSELAEKYGTDKGPGGHGYTEVYPRYLEKMRHRAVRLLELGIGEGASLLMWREFFGNSNAELFAIDNRVEAVNCLSQEDRITPIWGNSSDGEFLQELQELEDRYIPDTYDIIIDDASHFPSHQMTAFKALWPALAPGGIYAIEDINVSLDPQWLEDRAESSIFHPFLRRLTKACVGQWADAPAFVHFYPELVILGKK